jgi:hypothetical protein
MAEPAQQWIALRGRLRERMKKNWTPELTAQGTGVRCVEVSEK